MRNHLSLIIACLLALGLFFLACRKSDFTGKSPSETESFFHVPDTVSPVIKRVGNMLRLQNSKREFITRFIREEGYPIWNNALVRYGLTSSRVNMMGRTATEGDTLVFIPVVLDKTEYVNSFLVAKLNGSDTIDTRIIRGEDYQDYGYNTGSGLPDANNIAAVFMGMEYSVFGHDRIKVTDPDLEYYNPSDTQYTGVMSLVSSTPTPAEGCYVRAYFEINQDGTRTQLTPWEEICPWDGWFPVFEEGGEGPLFPSIPSSGGGGGGSNPPSGWSSLPPIPPYVCNYQLAPEEQAIFDQLDQEDEAEDYNRQNFTCRGTKRTGNINFTGTKEHWLIQLDYVSKNLLGEAEYSIPGASLANPTRRGFADLVNLGDGSIFEIKPNNQAGVQSGATEVANYVAKATLNCTSSLPTGVSWKAGTNYSDVVLPTSIPNRYLRSTLAEPGVIGYEYTSMSPSTVPVTIPKSIADKFKHLIDRLRQNAADANRIIAEYLRQNPDLVNYIKTAAIGAGVAIIVGTILEDIITAGVGIADDWASFVLAYRIIRFGLAL